MREKARGWEREKESKEGESERDRGDRGSHNAAAANGAVALLESYSNDNVQVCCGCKYPGARSHQHEMMYV